LPQCHVGRNLANPLIASATDTDGDGLGDCREAADTNGDTVVLFPTDAINAVKVALLASGAMGRDGVFDLNADGAILFPTDAVSAVKAALVAGSCL
jgi:hypothetical protein